MINKKILVIEDTPGLLRSLSHSFALEGFEVFEAMDGNEALALMDNDVPDVIITDLIMPGMDGLTFIKKIKSDLATKEIPIVVFSAKPENREEVLTLGVQQFLSKPTSLDNVVSSVFEAIA